VPARAPLHHLVLLPLLALALTLAAAVLGPVPGASAASTQRVQRASTVAIHQIGDRYRYGATGPNAFDCSGLVQYSFRKAGIGLPRTAAAQARRAHRISKSKLRRGDLMFFSNGGRVYHAAIFLQWRHGKAQMVHAPGSGQRVKRATPWTSSWFAATVRR
jgi:cell wall-associated NlpC family hydrolase